MQRVLGENTPWGSSFDRMGRFYPYLRSTSLSQLMN